MRRHNKHALKINGQNITQPGSSQIHNHIIKTTPLTESPKQHTHVLIQNFPWPIKEPIKIILPNIQPKTEGIRPSREVFGPSFSRPNTHTHWPEQRGTQNTHSRPKYTYPPIKAHKSPKTIIKQLVKQNKSNRNYKNHLHEGVFA
jgi:hypothetical protein